MPPATSELRDRGVVELRAALGARRISPIELMEATLAEIDRLEPRLNAFITVDRERALRQARDIRPASPLPLAGIPFSVKDTIEVAGLPATAGSLLFEKHVPARTASVVERLRKAGAILVGKTNCAEFGIGNLETCSPIIGQTHNPWSPLHTPGGSGGGDSSAVAAGMAAFGVGTDYGGSVRFPAHCTGVAALRPTTGRVPLDGQLPQFADVPAPGAHSRLQRELQTPGFLGRTVDDLELLLQVASGRELAAPGAERIAWFIDDVDEDTARTMRDAAAAFDAAGTRIMRVQAPDVKNAAEVLAALRDAEGLPEIATWSRGRERMLSPLVRDQLSRPIAARNPDADAQLRRWLRWAAEMFKDHDVLLMPVAAEPAFLIEPDTQPDRSALDRCTRLITLLNLPAVAVPCGTSASGLPIGVQTVAAPGRDEDAIAAARILEAAFGRWTPPKAMP